MLLRVDHGHRKIPKSTGMLVSSKHESRLQSAIPASSGNYQRQEAFPQELI